MNIFFAINNGYVKYLLVTLVSILENNKDQEIKFYIIGTDITEDSKKKIDLLKRIYRNFNVTYLVTDRALFTGLKLNMEHITMETYFRYIIADLVPSIEKCLYLDADLVVDGNLSDFYNMDIKEYYCAGVSDIGIIDMGYKKEIDFLPSDLYINTGVMLMNLKKIRNDGMIEKLFLNTNEWKDRIQYQDQDGINITFKNNILKVDSIYNFTSSYVKEKEKRGNAVIIHYTGPKKPWHKNCRNKMNFVWKYYRYMTKAAIDNNKTNKLKLFAYKIYKNTKQIYFRLRYGL